MTAIMDVASILSKIEGIDEVATLNLTDTQAKDLDSTIALITEVFSDTPDNYASNSATSFIDTLSISIFYGTSKTETSSSVESAIFNALENAGWYQVSNSGHTLDPESGQYSINKHFSHKKER